MIDQDHAGAIAPQNDGSEPADDGLNVTADVGAETTDGPEPTDLQVAPQVLRLFNVMRRTMTAINSVAAMFVRAPAEAFSMSPDERDRLIAARDELAAITTAEPGTIDAQLNDLMSALTEVCCHAVANLHPQSTRDIPAEALEKASALIELFYPDPQRADDLAHVWAERAQLVEEWRDRRGREGEPEPEPTPFPTAVAAGYLQSRQGNPGVFGGQHEIGTGRDGQPVIMQRTKATRKTARKAPPTRRAKAAAPAKRTPAKKKGPPAKAKRGKARGLGGGPMAR